MLPVVLKFQNTPKIYDIRSALEGENDSVTNNAYIEYPKRVLIPPTKRNFTKRRSKFCKTPQKDFVYIQSKILKSTERKRFFLRSMLKIIEFSGFMLSDIFLNFTCKVFRIKLNSRTHCSCKVS